MLQSSIRAAFFISSLFAPAVLAGGCKPLPLDYRWPSQADWKALNKSVSRRLVTPIALGAVCHPDQNAYNKATCTDVQSQWTNSSWHALDPWSVNYNNNTCCLNLSQPCSTDGYPAYVVKAECAESVQAAVKFTGHTGMRLIIKGTDHNFMSCLSGTLFIWTHLLQGVKIKKGDPQAKKYEGVATVNISAGMCWSEVYITVTKDKLTVIDGSDSNIRVGGLLANGGYSPISGRFGLPTDNMLEMEVITADEKHWVINEDSDADLFWAL